VLRHPVFADVLIRLGCGSGLHLWDLLQPVWHTTTRPFCADVRSDPPDDKKVRIGGGLEELGHISSPCVIGALGLIQGGDVVVPEDIRLDLSGEGEE